MVFDFKGIIIPKTVGYRQARRFRFDQNYLCNGWTQPVSMLLGLFGEGDNEALRLCPDMRTARIINGATGRNNFLLHICSILNYHCYHSRRDAEQMLWGVYPIHAYRGLL